MKRVLQLAAEFSKSVDTVQKIFAAVLAVLGALAIALNFISSNNPFAIAIRDNLIWIWLVVLTLLAFVILYRVSQLSRRFLRGLSINFRGDLAHTWEFQGLCPWSTTTDHELIVTNSYEGGITKVGHYWENYDLFFKAHIISHCIGVIVRAESLHNYYMFQIHKDSIVPHRRILIRLNEPRIIQDQKEDSPGAARIDPGRYVVAWEVGDPIRLNRNIEGWFDGKITVKGEAVFIYIKNHLVYELVYEQKDLLKIPSGKIGFRNDGPEKALVKDVCVALHPYY